MNGEAAYISPERTARHGGGTGSRKGWYHEDSHMANHPSMEDCTSEAVTHNVRVEVESKYAPEYSQPFQGQWRFIYTIRITNEGEERVQLLRRHWIITDATGHVEEVEGPGVIGQQPELSPGE